jgi:two-component system, sensor histidine kinase and response regulator
MTIRLLCVDDDPLITQSLGAVLRAVLKNWDIQILNDPQQALTLLDTWQPDVVISDMMMPTMSGLDFLTRIRDRCPGASLLMLTGYADKQSAITAINSLGLFYYLEKPWNVDTLPVILRKAAEHSELRHHLTDAQTALEKEQTISRLREDFVATLTHDLRTPLIASEQTLGMLIDGKLGSLTDRQQQVVTMLQTNQKDLLKLVNSLLLVYQFESGECPLAVAPLHLTQWLPGVLQPLLPLAATKQHKLEFQHDNTQPTVLADGFSLQRVMTNLVSNAIEYTPPGGRILVQLSTLTDHAVIQVWDNGRGIPTADVPQLFQRFTQGTSKVRSSGSGLGLYLSKQIVEAHGGSISVKSQEGKGSVFNLTMPLAGVQEALKNSVNPLNVLQVN